MFNQYLNFVSLAQIDTEIESLKEGVKLLEDYLILYFKK